MLSKNEIRDVAADLGLSLDVIEKDYVLGWIIAGINADQDIKYDWIFKGGTCLKKCFFGNYRFSEDLDFTLKDSAHLDTNFLEAKFKSISEWIYDQAGIELPIKEIDFKERTSNKGFTSIKGKITYRGPIVRQGSSPRIKLDLTSNELLIKKPIKSKVYHAYSDLDPYLFSIHSYSYAEIFAEKLRAIAERSLPRDLYDVVEIYRRVNLRPSHSEVLEILIKKCAFKNINPPDKTLMKDTDKIIEIQSAWNSMLKHQLKDLPSMDIYVTVFDELMNWLYQG